MSRIIRCSICQHPVNPDAKCVTCGREPWERNPVIEAVRVQRETMRAWRPKHQQPEQDRDFVATFWS